MLVKELSAFVAQTVEFPWVTLPVFTIGKRSLFDDASIYQLLNVLVDGGIAEAWIQLLELVHRGELFGVL